MKSSLKPLLALLAWAGIYVAFYFIARSLPFKPSLVFLYVILSRFICVGTTLLLFYFLYKYIQPGLRVSITGFLTGLVLFFVFQMVVSKNSFEISITYVFINVFLSLVSILFLFFGGVLLSCGFKRIQFLLPLIIFVPAIDIYSVLYGPTNHIVHHKPAVLKLLLFSYPLMGKTKPVGMLGLADLLFMAFLLAICFKHSLPVKKNIAAMLLALLAGFILIYFTAGQPLFPYISLAFLIVNWKYILKDRRGLKQVSIVTTGVFLIVSLFLVFYNR